MGRKKENNYFDMFIQAVTYSCQAADMLKENFISFDPEQLPACHGGPPSYRTYGGSCQT